MTAIRAKPLLAQSRFGARKIFVAFEVGVNSGWRVCGRSGFEFRGRRENTQRSPASVIPGGAPTKILTGPAKFNFSLCPLRPDVPSVFPQEREHVPVLIVGVEWRQPVP